VAFDATTSGAVAKQVSDYYPFGMRHDVALENDNNYLYNGKEIFDMYDFNLYHFGARMYDPALGRWHSVDPMLQFASPYIGIGNNPANFVDPDGRYSGDQYSYEDHQRNTNNWFGDFWKKWWKGQKENIYWSNKVCILIFGLSTSGPIYEGAGAAVESINEQWHNNVDGGVDMGEVAKIFAATTVSSYVMDLTELKFLEDRKIPFRNSLKYMAKSTVHDVTYNKVYGNPAFQDVDFGLNPGLILPATIDLGDLTAKYWANTNFAKNMIAKRLNKLAKSELKVEPGSYLDYEFEINDIDIGLYGESYGIEVDYSVDITDSYLDFGNFQISGAWPWNPGGEYAGLKHLAYIYNYYPYNYYFASKETYTKYWNSYMRFFK